MSKRVANVVLETLQPAGEKTGCGVVSDTLVPGLEPRGERVHAELLMEALSARYDRVRAYELDRARKMLAAGQPAHVAMEALSRRVTSKVLHDPLSALSAAGGERDRLAAALIRIYGPEAGGA